MHNIAISVSGLSKKFQLKKEITALKDISFRLNKGDVVALIGDNGAGKSTLLKVLSGLLKPDSGFIEYVGQLSSILDIGSGFHPDLTGTDNVFMSGRLMGLSDREIKYVLPDIVEFSELAEHMETPLKYYSSGMFLRLAFSVSTSFQSDILLLDEVMGVGDLHFLEKSKERIKRIVKSGSTVVMASHNIDLLSNMCTHGLWLSNGEMRAFGEIEEVIDAYLASDQKKFVETNREREIIENSKNNRAVENQPEETIYTEEHAETHQITDYPTLQEGPTIIELVYTGVKAVGKTGTYQLCMNDELLIEISYRKLHPNPVILFVVIQDKFNRNLLSISSHRVSNPEDFVEIKDKGLYSHTIKIPKGFFNQGLYSIGLYFTDEEEKDIAGFHKALSFRVIKASYQFHSFTFKKNFSGPFLPFFQWETKRLVEK
jgi:ABC-type polysaccharide/polyol phosphate transport system ATPase subunit